MQPKKSLQQTCYEEISDRINVKKVCVVIFACYVALAVAFYFLAGEQLHFRDSRGNIKMPVANSGTVELIAGTKIEQVFTPRIQRLKQISVTWGDYGRKNRGTVIVELYNKSNMTLIQIQKLDASKLTQGMVTTMSFDRYIENLNGVPLLLRITSPDGSTGTAVTPLMKTDAVAVAGSPLFLNKQVVNGVLCFTAEGQDYIWFGLHYWAFAAAGGVLLAAYLVYFMLRVKRQKKSILMNAMVAMKKYRFLIHQLVSRDFRTKYKRSILGIFWSFLNPLLMMGVQYYVFSTIFKAGIPYYPVYLLTGIVMFNFFSESCGMTLTSILGNAGLITKVYVPKYIYPLTRVLSSLINLLISLVPLIAMVLISRLPITKAFLLFPFSLLCLAIFCLGLGLLLAAGMVFFRDIQFLWSVISMIWMYATPIFYPESILPDEFKFVLTINPMYYFIKFARTCLISGISPEPVFYFQSMLFSLGMLLVGAFVFRKTQDKFILYI
jgi:ABC-type polysaccharide/polyol phosphate export systems, permease component